MQTTLISFLNTAKHRLVGVLDEPTTPSATFNKQPLVILCHGLACHKNSFAFPDLSKKLAKEIGVSVLRFDFSGNADSEGEFSYCNYHEEVEDLRCAIQEFRTRSFGSKQYEISTIIGHSKAGSIVLMYAAKYQDVPIVINISGRFDLTKTPKGRFSEEQMQTLEKEGKFLWQTLAFPSYSELLEQGSSSTTTKAKPKENKRELYVTKQALEERSLLDMKVIYKHFAEPAASKTPSLIRLLTIHGSGDEIIPSEDAHALLSYFKNDLKLEEQGYQLDIEIIEGANHSYSKHRKPLIKFLTGYLQKAIQG